MAGMTRKIMRCIRKANAEYTLTAHPSAAGTVRAGMHQKAEHAYRRSRMSDVLPEEIPAGEEALAETAEGVTGIGPDEEILEEIADPDAAAAEETEEDEETADTADAAEETAEAGPETEEDEAADGPAEAAEGPEPAAGE